jgi:AraC family L-rhamnose operon regulatory protein RhaS
MIRQLPRRPRQFFDLFEEFGSGSIARLPKHQNGGFELHYIAKGHLHWEIEGRPFLVPPHSVFFTFPWEKHGSCVDFEPGHFFHFAVFRVKKQQKVEPKKVRLVSGFGFSETEQDQIFRKLLSARNRCFAAGHDLGWLIARLVRELAHPGVMARANVIALSQATLCELVKSVHSQRDQNQKNSPSEQKVLRFVDDLRLNCSKPWTLDAMAAACHLKRTQFEILIKNLTGDTPLFLLNRFRVRQSQQFLKNSDKTITEIAFDAGFGSSQYFSRVFQSLVGTTPSEYRRHQGSLADYDQRFLGALTQLQKQTMAIPRKIGK